MLLIRTLRCRVTVKQKEKSSPAHKPAGATKPSFAYTTPPPQAPAGPSVPPSQSATEGTGSGAGENRPISAHGVDPAKVADRVYQLIVEEARKERLRGLS